MNRLFDELADLCGLEHAEEISEYFELEYVTALPPEELTLAEWAEKYRVMTSDTSAISGPWSNALYPHTVGIMTAISSGVCTEVIVVGGTQLAKSEVYINAIGYFIQTSPRSMGLLTPTQDKTEEIFDKRIRPMIENAKDGVLQKLCTIDGRKILETELSYVGGDFYLAWATSASTLSSRPLARVFVDEEDEMEPLKKYGHPIDLIKERFKSYLDSLIVRVGKPMKKDGIEKSAETADYYFKRWVACPHCGGEFLFEQSGLRPQNVPLSKFRHAWYECPHCHEQITEAHRKAMLPSAVWRTDDGDELDIVLETSERITVAFHVSSFYAPFITFDMMMRKYLEAKKSGHASLKVYYEGWLGISYDSVSSIPDEDIRIVREHLEDYTIGLLPAGVVLLTCAVDVQKDRLEVLIKGWGRNLENWRLFKIVLSGSPISNIPWDALDRLLAQKYPHPCGVSLPVYTTVVDSGYMSDYVYAYTQRRESLRVYSIKGGSNQKAPLVMTGAKGGVVKATLYIVNSHALKTNTYNYLADTIKMIKGEAEKPVGCMHFNEECDDTTFHQLMSERLVTIGNTSHYEKKPGYRRNEEIDLHGYNEAALHLSEVNINEWADEIEKRLGGAA